MNLYDLHDDPQALYGYDRGDMEVADVFWGRYKGNLVELKKREAAIAKSAKHSYLYADLILKKSFPKGEAAIAKNAEYAYLYARNILKSPFPAGEAAIAKHIEYRHDYDYYVLKKSFPS